MERNDCYNCPARSKVPGSAHSLCQHPVANENMESLVSALMIGRRPEVKIAGISCLTINEHGFNRGWASWPLNFDPVWIHCTLPITEEQGDDLIELIKSKTNEQE